jgi:hypothetical protein
MSGLEPTMQKEWLKLLTDDQLIAITRLSASLDRVGLSGLSNEELERIVAGDLEPLRGLYSEEEWLSICGE